MTDKPESELKAKTLKGIKRTNKRPWRRQPQAAKESERYANSILRQSGKFVRSDVVFAHYSGIMWLMEQIKEINDESIADAQFYGHHAKAWELEEKLKLLLELK